MASVVRMVRCPCGSAARAWRGLCGRCLASPSMRAAHPAPAGDAPRPLCRHCGAAFVCRPRGLCTGCFNAPGVRQLYPSGNPWSARPGAGAEPPEPTDWPPGSEGKIEAMAARHEAGYAVTHPADARYPGDPLPARWRAGRAES